MSIPNLYETDMGDQTMDVSAATRQFQASIIVKQDLNKSGLLSLLQEVEQETPTTTTRTPPQTVRPTTQGGY